MRWACLVVLQLLLIASLINGVKSAANMEMAYVFVSPDKPKTYEPTVIEVAILNHEGSGQYYDLTLAQSGEFGTGSFVDWDGHVAMFSGYANPYWQTRASFILSPIVAGQVKLSLTLRDASANVVDTWEEVITIEKGDLETQLDSVNGNITSLKNSLGSLNSALNTLSSTMNSTSSSQEAVISTLQDDLEATRNTLTATQTGFAMAIIIVFAAFSGLVGFLYYRGKFKQGK